ncbi:hypothetical protein, partial [Ralstonia pseudosolanacearum]
ADPKPGRPGRFAETSLMASALPVRRGPPRERRSIVFGFDKQASPMTANGPPQNPPHQRNQPPASVDGAAASQRFDTERFIVIPLSGHEARNLVGILLQDEALASRIDWMEDKSRDGALREAFGIELRCNAGQARVWSIIERARRLQIGAILASHSLEGLDVEVLVASPFWDQDVSDEAGAPVIDWLQRRISEANPALA